MDKKNNTINRIELDEKTRQFTSKCREASLKVTPQRIAIYSLDTVNRTLLTLNEIGAAFTVVGSGDARRFDGGLHEHQHFRCIKCKRIIDFHHKPFDNIRLPAEISEKYKVLRKTVYLEGLCDLCG